MADTIREELIAAIPHEGWCAASDDRLTRCVCFRARASIADAVLSSSVVARIRAEAKVEALREAADEFAPGLADPAPGFVRGVDQVRAYLRNRADEEAHRV